MTKNDDAPVDESRRQFIKKAPVATVGGTGALAGIGTSAALGAKALFSQGKFDDVLEKIKLSLDEDWNFFSADEAFNTIKEKLNLSDSETIKLFDDSGYFGKSPESKNDLLEKIDDTIENLTNEETIDSFNQLIAPAFKNEIIKKFPDVDKDELNDLAESLF